MTIVPRTGPLSASSALASTSWYHWGKSLLWLVRTEGIALVYNAALPQVGRRRRYGRVLLALIDFEGVQRCPGDAGGEVGPVDVAIAGCAVVGEAVDVVQVAADRPRGQGWEPGVAVDQ